MTCPNCGDYADYQASLSAQAEAEYQAAQEEEFWDYMKQLLIEEKYDLHALEYVLWTMGMELPKESIKILSEKRRDIEHRYKSEVEVKKEVEENKNPFADLW